MKSNVLPVAVVVALAVVTAVVAAVVVEDPAAPVDLIAVVAVTRDQSSILTQLVVMVHVFLSASDLTPESTRNFVHFLAILL